MKIELPLDRPGTIPVNIMRPDAATEDKLPLHRRPTPPYFWDGSGCPPDTPVEFYMLGECPVIVTREFGK